ncbi:MAG: chorismate synthase [Coriobacteriales bacterium]|jgi:chorismate synthase|nr:chorismate synthase [Coriobacteriales bacterium]
MHFTTAGESHGSFLVTVVTDVPAGVSVTTGIINAFLARRRSGYGRSERMTFERDEIQILSGVQGDKSTGAPLAVLIANVDSSYATGDGSPPDDRHTGDSVAGDPPSNNAHSNNCCVDDFPSHNDQPSGAHFNDRHIISPTKDDCIPRPGHADMAALQKIGATDLRAISERASGRETAARVVAGAIAASYLAEFGVEVSSFVTGIGSVDMPAERVAAGVLAKPPFTRVDIEASPVRCPDADTTSRIVAAIDAAAHDGDTLGGRFMLVVRGLVPGLGSYTCGPERLSSLLAATLASIPTVKGLEFGRGFDGSYHRGSQINDVIALVPEDGCIQPGRLSNNLGGLEGGMTNGQPLVVRVATKAPPGLARPLASVDLMRRQTTPAPTRRSDVCVVPAVAVVAEAEAAVVLASACQKKFGGDTVADAQAACEHYRERLAALSTCSLNASGG